MNHVQGRNVGNVVEAPQFLTRLTQVTSSSDLITTRLGLECSSKTRRVSSTTAGKHGISILFGTYSYLTYNNLPENITVTQQKQAFSPARPVSSCLTTGSPTPVSPTAIDRAPRCYLACRSSDSSPHGHCPDPDQASLDRANLGYNGAGLVFLLHRLTLPLRARHRYIVCVARTVRPPAVSPARLMGCSGRELTGMVGHRKDL
jgi:hypothetical protein